MKTLKEHISETIKCRIGEKKKLLNRPILAVNLKQIELKNLASMHISIVLSRLLFLVNGRAEVEQELAHYYEY